MDGRHPSKSDQTNGNAVFEGNVVVVQGATCAWGRRRGSRWTMAAGAGSSRSRPGGHRLGRRAWSPAARMPPKGQRPRYAVETRNADPVGRLCWSSRGPRRSPGDRMVRGHGDRQRHRRRARAGRCWRRTNDRPGPPLQVDRWRARACPSITCAMSYRKRPVIRDVFACAWAAARWSSLLGFRTGSGKTTSFY